jgi:transposase-like protein
VQYGNSAKAAAVYVKNYQFLPYKRACELLADLLGCPMSEGTLANILSQCDELTQSPVAQIKEKIIQAPVVHFDETGSRVEGKRRWLHTASTENATTYDIHFKRGSEAMDEIGILPKFTGCAIHDFWISYYKYACSHSLCNAHHLAEKQIQTFELRFEQILNEGYIESPLPPLPPHAKKKRGRRKKSKPRNQLERLDKQRKEALAFMYDFNVPFDNNLAERDIRMMKVQQKISGTFRTEDGAKTFCSIRSYISTARKNAVSAMDALSNLFRKNPFVPTSDSTS